MTEQQANDISTDLIVVGDEYTLPIVPTAQVKAIAARLLPMLPTFPKAFDVQGAVLVAEIALARGHNPLSVGKQFHAWRDEHGKICVQDHFAAEETWAQSKEKFRAIYHDLTDEEKSGIGIDKRDFSASCTIIRASYEHLYQERYNSILNAAIMAKIDFGEALKVAEREALKIGTTHISKVGYDEVYKTEDGQAKIKQGSGAPRGWVPGLSRARVRALRGAIHQVYGTPTFAEMARLGLKSASEDMPEIIAEMPDEVALLPQPLQQKWVNLDERRRENDESERLLQEMLGPEKYAEYSKRRQQKNTTMMRGEVLTDDWLDEKKEERKGPDWRDAYVVEVPAKDIELSQEDKDLIDYAKSMGVGVVDIAGSPDELFPTEPEKSDSDIGVAMSIGDVKFAMAPIYQTSVVQLEVIKKLYGDDASWEKLTQAQLWNIKQYTKRMIILHKQTDLSVEERLAKIPEVAEATAEEAPKTIVAAKELLRGIVRSLGVAGKMKELV